MKETKIYSAATRMFPPNTDVEHYLEILFKNKEKEWFAPNNRDDDAFTICRELSGLQLIAERKIPKWNDGLFRGCHTEFMYVKSMEYGC